MARSKYKVIFVHRSQIGKYFHNKIKRSKRSGLYKHMVNRYISVSPLCFFWKRYSHVSKKLLNKKICIYNGKIFHIINTNQNFRGFKLGEFSVSRKKPLHKGKQRQIKKVIKKKIRR